MLEALQPKIQCTDFSLNLQSANSVDAKLPNHSIFGNTNNLYLGSHASWEYGNTEQLPAYVVPSDSAVVVSFLKNVYPYRKFHFNRYNHMFVTKSL